MAASVGAPSYFLSPSSSSPFSSFLSTVSFACLKNSLKVLPGCMVFFHAPFESRTCYRVVLVESVDEGEMGLQVLLR